MNYPAPLGRGFLLHGQHLHHGDVMQRSWLHRLKGLFHPHTVNIHRSIIISIGNKPTVWAFVDSLGERLFHDASTVRTHLCRVAGIDFDEFRTSTFSLVREVRITEYTQDDISIAGRKGGSTSIPGGKTGDFPLRPPHPRKLIQDVGDEGSIRRAVVQASCSPDSDLIWARI